MGHNIDFQTAFSLSLLKCPHCESDIDREFEELDIDCGVNQMATGFLELDITCPNCEKEIRVTMELDLKLKALD